MSRLSDRIEAVSEKWFNLDKIKNVTVVGKKGNEYNLFLNGKKYNYMACLNTDTMQAYISISDLYDIITDIDITDRNRRQIADFWAELEEMSL